MDLKTFFLIHEEESVLTLRVKARSNDEILHFVISHVNDAIIVSSRAKDKRELPDIELWKLPHEVFSSVCPLHPEQDPYWLPILCD